MMSLSEEQHMRIAKQIAMAETEDDIDRILAAHQIFHDDNNWRNYGDLPNNFGTIGNQQSDATSALVEKLINSIDAVLINEARLRGIDPEGKEAPKTMVHAVEQFFYIKNGNLNLIPIERQKELADNINLIATGLKTRTSYIIYDKGEGQSPSKIPETFLSLHCNNKDKIPFVQGRFNMGGSGALPFCGEKNYQFLLTKKHPILKDDDENKWGYTLVRRRRPGLGEKSSVYEYFAPNQKIACFKADEIQILPSTNINQYDRFIKYGSFIKLYEYDIEKKSNITPDLYKVLNNKLFEVALPIKMIENRDYGGHTNENILTGMVARIENQRSRIESEFPIISKVKIPGLGNAKVRMWLFKDEVDSSNWYKSSEAVVLTVNGQSHATFDKRFFSRIRAGQNSWIRDSLLVQVDCTNFSQYARENLFMGSRDRMRKGKDLSNKVERKLEEIIKNDEILKKWNKIRRQQKMENVFAKNDKHTQDLFQKMISSNPEIAFLFKNKGSLSDPTKRGETEKPFIGKRFPTYFELVNPPDGLKKCPQNSICRIIFKTDVQNDFFDRDFDPGKLIIKPAELISGEKLRNGNLTLTVNPSGMNLDVGETKEIEVICDSNGAAQTFKHIITLEIISPLKKGNKPAGNPKKRNNSIKAPEIQLLDKEQWENIIGNWDKEYVIDIKESEEEVTIFINKDNVHLQRALVKEKDEIALDLLKEQFKYAIGLIGFSVYGNVREDDEKDKLTKKASESVAQIILPMLNWFINNVDELKGA